jgi:hypothetical protein
MGRTNKSPSHTIVIRFWIERGVKGDGAWRGTVLHPHSGEETHFQGKRNLMTNLDVLLDELTWRERTWATAMSEGGKEEES